MKVQYRQFADQADLPLISAGVDLLGLPIMEQDAECLNSFNGAVDWKQITLESGVQGSKVVFLFESKGISVCTAEYDESGVMSCQYLDVRIHTSFSFLPSLVHTVMAPAFTPGFVGVDWEVVKTILRSGKHAQLAMMPGVAYSKLLKAANQIKDEHGHKVKGLLLVLFLGEREFHMPIYKQAAQLLESEFVCQGVILIAVPSIMEQPEPMLALLVVYA